MINGKQRVGQYVERLDLRPAHRLERLLDLIEIRCRQHSQFDAQRFAGSLCRFQHS
jgi:hypothetical protein